MGAWFQAELDQLLVFSQQPFIFAEHWSLQILSFGLAVWIGLVSSWLHIKILIICKKVLNIALEGPYVALYNV